MQLTHFRLKICESFNFTLNWEMLFLARVRYARMRKANIGRREQFRVKSFVISPSASLRRALSNLERLNRLRFDKAFSTDSSRRIRANS